MEQLEFMYKAHRPIVRTAHVGVVSSGDLEVLMEPSESGAAEVCIRTHTEGFGEVWRVVLDRFFETHDLAVKIQMNDFGATPGVVLLRLYQAVEVLES